MLDDEPCLGCDEPQHLCTCTRMPVAAAASTTLVFTYTNHRGETLERHVTDWHERDGKVRGFDLGRGARRTFEVTKMVGRREVRG